MIQLIVPPIKSGGVYDFACRLQEAFGEANVQLIHLSEDSVAEWRIGSDDSVILQMSGYGFSKRGTPLWLLRELEKRRAHIKRFGVFFHELYAMGPPWRSSFWLSPLQRRVSRRLAELADFWMTNREGAGEWLMRYVNDKPHAVLPVFSNVGELDFISKDREPIAVIFGGSSVRTATYKCGADEIFEWARNAKITLHDIGPPINDLVLNHKLEMNGVVQHGVISADIVSVILSSASFGVVAYPVSYIAKSGIFAAYCAHGVCPIVFSKNCCASDGLILNVNYFDGLLAGNIRFSDLSDVGLSAWSWYQSHRISEHIKSIEYLLTGQSNSC